MQAWVQEVLSKYTSGVSIGFILHLNVFDYVEPGVPMDSYLAQVMADRKVVAIYDRARGISFPLPSMKEPFMALTGWRPDPLNPTGELPRAAGEALPLLEKLLKAQSEGNASAVIIHYAETLVPAADLAMMMTEDRNTLVTLEKWARDPEINKAGNPVFLVTANLAELHQAIRAASAKYECIRVPIPNLDQRRAYIEQAFSGMSSPE